MSTKKKPAGINCESASSFVDTSEQELWDTIVRSCLSFRHDDPTSAIDTANLVVEARRARGSR